MEAEQLLRQGKLAGAIEAYVRLVEDRPSDWNSINAFDGFGETARTLAVLIDFDLDSGGYRDGRARVDRLMLAQAGSLGQ